MRNKNIKQTGAPGVAVQQVVGRRAGVSTDQLCKMIREAVADRPDLNPRNKMRLTRTEMLDGKPVRCYIET